METAIEMEGVGNRRQFIETFETMIGKVAAIEKALGIYCLAQFTPKL
jgi:hypothetical protein